MKEIQLTQGKVALVDDEDFDRVNQYKWWLGYDANKKNPNYYAIRVVRISHKKTLFKLHNLILKPPVGMFVDHINGNSLDNRRSNLRICTNAQNAANKRPQKGCSSSYKGVQKYEKSKWRAYVRFENKLIHLGCFNNEIKAAKTYDVNAVLLFGEFARLNFPIAEGE